MQFLSLQFIVSFTIFFWCYWLVCKSKTSQNFVLLIASYLFYGLYDWRFVPLLFLTSMAAYTAGICFEKCDGTRLVLHKTGRWWISCVSIFFCVAILCYFKYTNFFLQSISDLTGGGITLSILSCLSGLVSIHFLQLVILLIVIRKKSNLQKI